MGQQVDVAGGAPLPAHVTLRVGDVARFWATGGRVQHGADVVALSAPFLRTAAPDDAGSSPRPVGLPNTVQLEARQPGRAIVQLFTHTAMSGQPSRTHVVEITVEEAS